MKFNVMGALLGLAAAGLAQTSPALLPDRSITSLCLSGDAVWAATDGGLYRIAAYSIRRAGPDGNPAQITGAPDGAVYARYGERTAVVWPDRFEWTNQPIHWPQIRSLQHQGWTWEATARGIVRRRIQPRFRRYALPNSDRVHALAAAPDGSIWCGTQKGVTHFARGRFEVEQPDLGLVTAVAVDREGRVWIGSGSGFAGVYRRDATGWKQLGGIDAYVHSIALDAAGTLWFAALNAPGGAVTGGRGAWFWSRGEFRRADWLGSRRVYDVAARDPSGVLWFATLKGLVAYEGPGKVTRYTPERGRLSEEKVWCLSVSGSGSLWLGYQGGGGTSRLARGRFTSFRKEDGLCSDQVWAVAEGTPGVLWFATDQGLSRYDGRRWSCFRFSPSGLWPLLPAADGSLWIGSLGDGLWRLVPDDTQAPVATIRSEQGRVSWSGTDAWFDTPSDRLWFRYRVDGGDWQPASRARTAALPSGSGRHTVEVQAIDRFGNVGPPTGVELERKGAGTIPWVWRIGFVLLVIGLLFWRRGS